ncbi:MAG: hypothetical protein WBP72_15375 [Rhodocyclaceae bacterium]
MQLDIFEHSRDVMLRNAVIEALEARDPERIERAIGALAAEYPGDALLPTVTILAARLAQKVAAPLERVPGAQILEATERAAEAAKRVFGVGAEAWMASLWRQLAAALVHLPFDPANEALHAAPLLLRAGDWSAAAEALAGIPSWRRLPSPLAWKAEAEGRTGSLAAVWPFLAELAWMAPERASALARHLALPELRTLLRRFDAEFEGEVEGGDFAWFPAWALVAEPHWADALRPAQAGADTAAERGARLVLNLLLLERQGLQAELVESRRKFRELHDPLFRRYMRSR